LQVVGKAKSEHAGENLEEPKRTEKKLSPLKLKTLGPGRYADGGGLYLDVQDSGSRSWIFRTTIRGKRKEIGLGGLSARSLAQAREAAADLLAKAKKGEDILEQKRFAERVIPIFEDAAKTVHTNLAATFESETHAYNWLQSLKSYVFPKFGKKTVNRIDSADILSAIGPIWVEKPDTAARTLRRIKAVLDYCQVQGFRTTIVNGIAVPMPNPCDGVRTALPKRNGVEKHHESLPYPDLPGFIQKLRTSPSALCVKLAFEFLILTSARTGEVLQAHWEEIDLDNAEWVVPAKRMKMKVEHKVPLSDRCVEILKLAKQFNDGVIVFPGRKAGEPLSNAAFLMALRRMGYEEVTAHGFRATFKTWAEEKTKFDSLVIEASMAHAVKGIERHYLRTTFFEQRKKLMDSWAGYATSTQAAKVVKIRR
jgi:integrase